MPKKFHNRTKGEMENRPAFYAGYKTGEKGIPPERPTLILIHGAGGSSQTFLHQVRHWIDR